MTNLMAYLRRLRLGESLEGTSIPEDEACDLRVATSFLLRDGREPTDPEDRAALEVLNERLHLSVEKVRVSFTKIKMKSGHVRWQVSMKSTDPEGHETSDLNVWAPTVLSGLVYIVMKLMGVG